MRSYIATLLVAWLGATLLTPVARKLGFRLGAVSQPGGRNVHASVIPRLGGLAIYGAFVLAIGALLSVDSSVAHIVRGEGRQAAGLLVGGTAMSVVGLVDDTRGLRALHKFGAQLVVATFAFVCGFRIAAISVPVLGNLSMGIFAYPVTVLWITGIVNAVNLIDGLDGLAAGVVLFAGLTNLAISVLTGSVFIAVTMAAVIGALLGFLMFNFNPARIFMGDSGSYFLGYVLATTVLFGATSQKASTAVSLLVPCLALGVPIFDTLFSIARRFLERRPLFSPDRGHIHHRLIDMGLTQRRAVLILYGVSAFFSVAAIAISLGKDWQIGIALLGSSTVLFALVKFAGYFEYIGEHMRRRGRWSSPRLRTIRDALPQLADSLSTASNDAAVHEILGRFAPLLGLASMRLVLRSHPQNAQSPQQHARSTRRDSGIPELTISVGNDVDARADLICSCREDDMAPTPEYELLLDLVGDLVQHALLRISSPLAARRAEPALPPAPRSERPAVTPSPIGTWKSPT